MTKEDWIVVNTMVDVIIHDVNDLTDKLLETITDGDIEDAIRDKLNEQHSFWDVN